SPAAAKPAAKKGATRKPAAKAARKAAPKAAPRAAAFAADSPASLLRMGDMAKMAKLMTPEQAIDLYKANTRMALDIINAAIEGTAKVRRLQFEGDEHARAIGH